MAERNAANAGFTLFEVLGAVAIMGISYALLATVAVQSVRSIGESQRRIQASMMADDQLAEIELAAEIGQPIELRDEEFDEEPFLVRVEVLDMEELYPPQGDVSQANNLIEYLAAESAGAFAELRQSNFLLGYLREIHVTVSWMEGIDEKVVTRTAFIYDQMAFTETEGQAEAEGEEGEDGEFDDGDADT